MRTTHPNIGWAGGALSVFRLPIVWLFVGPPALRFVTERSAMASMQGSYDFWNILQVGWWLFWGGVAARDLFLARGWFADVRRRTGSFALWTSLWLFALLLSCGVSPAPLFSLANVGMLCVLVVAAADLGVKVYGGWVSPRRLLGLLLAVAVGLLLLIVGIALIAPTAGGIGVIDPAEMRIRGGSVGYAPLLSLVVVFAGLYFWLTTKGGARLFWAFVVVCGVVFLALGQTRSSYGGFLAGIAVFTWLWARLGTNPVRLMTGGAILLVVGCGSVLAYHGLGDAAAVYDTLGRLIIREEQTISSLTGRTDVIAVLLDAVAQRPLGLGFSAGPRHLLLSDRFVEAMHTDAFGNAHNAYLEVLAGGGYLAFVAWMVVVGLVLYRGHRVRTRRSVIPFLALLVAVLLEGVTESLLVLPFEQTSVLFWAIAATVLALSARTPPTATAAPGPTTHGPSINDNRR